MTISEMERRRIDRVNAVISKDGKSIGGKTTVFIQCSGMLK